MLFTLEITQGFVTEKELQGSIEEIQEYLLGLLFVKGHKFKANNKELYRHVKCIRDIEKRRTFSLPNDRVVYLHC